MKRYYLSTLTALTFASSAFACGADDYIGSICTTAAATCPGGTLEANGAILTITNNAALYSLIGAYFGGDGRTTFALPDLRGRAPVELSYNVPSPTNQPVSIGTKRGTESVTLTMVQMPQHIHTATFTPGSGTNPIKVTIPASSNLAGNTNQPSATNNYIAASANGTAGGNMWASAPGSAPVTLAGVNVSGDTNSGSVTLATTGTAAPVPTISPELGLKYCVVSKGTYPPRP